MVPFALPKVALVLRPTLPATKLTVGFAHLIYISTIWRNYLFHLTYILYHSFYFLANYYCYEFLYIRAIIKQFLFLFLEFSFTHPAPRGGIKIAGPGVTGFEPANAGVMVPKVRVELTSFLSFDNRKILSLNYSDKSCALPLGDTPIISIKH